MDSRPYIAETYFTPKMRERLVTAETIGYFGGPYPYLPLLVNNDRVNVECGQVVDVRGKFVHALGAFGRSAAINVAFNYPINPIAYPHRDIGYLRYYTTHTQLSVDARKGGSAFHLKKGRMRFKYASTADSQFDVILLRTAPKDVLEVDYSDFINDGFVEVQHTNGESVSDDVLVHKRGYFRSESYASLIAGAGIDPDDIKYIAARCLGGEIILEENTLMVLAGSNVNSVIRFRYEIEDMGVHYAYGVDE